MTVLEGREGGRRDCISRLLMFSLPAGLSYRGAWRRPAKGERERDEVYYLAKVRTPIPSFFVALVARGHTTPR